MAESPAHRFGQIIGEVLEAAIAPVLTAFAKEHGLYLDKQGERPCRPGKRCTWLDLNKNKHDLDFVLERGGSTETLGVPAAFIETAWRRYTKHSRNKAQEIQGAILPLAEAYRLARQVVGVDMAGAFTDGAISTITFPWFHCPSLFASIGCCGFQASTALMPRPKKIHQTPSFKRKCPTYEALVNHSTCRSGARSLEYPKGGVSRHSWQPSKGFCHTTHSQNHSSTSATASS